MQPAQLDYYLNEFTFRFNRRTSRSRGLLFYRFAGASRDRCRPVHHVAARAPSGRGKAAHAVSELCVG